MVDRYETEPPIIAGAEYRIVSASGSRFVSIWNEVQGNNPGNSSLTRGEGAGIHLNSVRHEEHDRWFISYERTDTEEGGARIYKIKSVCDKYPFVVKGATVGRGVNLRSSKSSWEIHKNPQAKANDEFYICYPEDSNLGWSYNESTDRSLQLKLDQDPRPWKFIRCAPQNPSAETNTKEKAPNSSKEPGITFGIDIGAAFTSVSFLDLANNLRQVTEWYTTSPGGQKIEGKSIPTRMYYPRGYSTYAKPAFYGSGQPSDELQYTKVNQFKSSMNKLSTLSSSDRDLLVKHYTEWFNYLFNNSLYISKESGVSDEAWKKRRVVVVVPNSWEHDQRILLKQAAINAGWVDRDFAEKNIKFLRECEATLHCLIKGDTWKSQNLKAGKEFVVLDAGHINYDVALYSIKSTSPLQFKEKGGNSPGTVGVTGGIRQAGKRPGGANKANDELHKRIIDKVTSMKKSAKVLFLVGDLDHTANLLSALIKKFPGIDITPIQRQNAADGALDCFKNSTVVAHAIPRSYGIEIWAPYEEEEDYMKGRTPIDCVDGLFVRFSWSPIVKYDEVLEGRTKHKLPFSKVFERKDPELLKFDVIIFAASPDANERWICDDEGNLYDGFAELFVIKADLSKLKDKLVEEGDDDQSYYRLDFEVEIIFDSINLQGNVLYEGQKYGRTSFELVKDSEFSSSG